MSSLDIEKEHAEFQRHMSNRGYAASYAGDGLYELPSVQDQWEAWLAAKRATQPAPSVPAQTGMVELPLAWAVEANIGNGMRAITKLTLDEAEADRYANRGDMARIGCGRKKIALYAITTTKSAGTVSGGDDATKALTAIEGRLALAYRLCCGLAPKQAVGELLDVALKMPEWDTLRSAIAAAWQRGEDARDAARYRWLRDDCYNLEEMQSKWLYGGFEAAIDAAIAAKESK